MAARVGIAQAEELVKSELGDKYQPVNLSGYWIIGWHDEQHGWHKVSRGSGRRSLLLAIDEAREELAR